MSATSRSAAARSGESGTIRVWDGFVRVFHWTVVVAFFVAYFTEGEPLTLHTWAGYTIGVLLLARIAWGFVGPRHARFSDFICSPLAGWRYLLELLRDRAPRRLGHSPAGGLMVLALIAGLSATVLSGMQLHAIENGAGPLAVAGAAPIELLPTAHASDHEHDEHGRDERHGAGGRGALPGGGEDTWEEVHELAGNVVLMLVLLHVGGVLLASARHRENLVAAMFSGRKRDT